MDGNKVTTAELSYRFDLVDERTAQNLTDSLQKEINVAKDYAWNNKLINAQLLEGILQGESIGEIAKRFLAVESRMSETAKTNARTMTTAAENKARLDTIKDAESKGVIQQKKWLATHDSRTRASHLKVDGETIDIDKKFGNGLMYPADPNGEPAEVYNCRCTLITVIKGFAPKGNKLPTASPTTPPLPPQAAKTGITADEIRAGTKTIEAAVKKADYDELIDLLDKCPEEAIKKLYAKYPDKNFRAILTKNTGVYQPASKTVNFCWDGDERANKFSTFAHEYGHAFDYLDDTRKNLTYTELTAVKKLSWSGAMFADKASSCDEYLAALRKDKTLLTVKTLDDIQNAFPVANDKYSVGVQDFISGAISGSRNHGIVRWGHAESYYNRKYASVKAMGEEQELRTIYQNLGFDAPTITKTKAICRDYETASELWANQMSAITCNSEEELKIMQEWCPNTFATIKSILGGL